MIIRSQDKTIITTNLNLWVSKEVVGCEIENDDFKLGAYSTEEKAIKVLDMIQSTYERHKLFATTYKDGVIQQLEKWHGLDGTRELIGSVFQMPQDDEVN